MSEMALTADEIIVIGQGKMIRQASVNELTAAASGEVLARSPSIAQFAALLQDQNIVVTLNNETTLTASGVTAEQVGEIAAAHRIVLHELTPQRASLEDVFMELTADSVEFSGHVSHTMGEAS